MDEQIGMNFEEEIIRLQKVLNTLKPGTEEYQKVNDELKKQYQMHLDGLKTEWDYDEKREKRINEAGRADEDLRIREHDEALKRDQFDEQKKDRWIRVIIAGVELVVPMVFYGVWMRRGFKFETTGTYTSNTFKGLWNRFRPFNK
jgi:hypothetical protein